MPEATLVLMEGRVDREKWSEGGQFGAGIRFPLWLRWAENHYSMPVFAAETHGRGGVQLHVGAANWPWVYELSKNLHC